MTAPSCPALIEPQSRRPETLMSLNDEKLSSRLNNSMDITDSKSAFRILETVGEFLLSGRKKPKLLFMADFSAKSQQMIFRLL